MTQSNEPTIEMNSEIAIFMGLIPIPAGTKRLGDIKHPEISEAFLNYHKDWGQLKPVIDEIFKYVLAYPDEVKLIIEMRIVVDIKPAHEKVYQFCKWLKQKQTNG